LGEGERRLRLDHLLFRLIDAGFLGFDLSIQIGDRRVCSGHLGLGLLDRGLVVAGVDLHQQAAGLFKLVVGHGHLGDSADHLGAHAHIAGVDECIVGGFVIAGVQPPHEAACNQGNHDNGDRNGGIWVPGQQAPNPLRRRSLLRLLIRLAPRPITTGLLRAEFAP
jgi:hypothetical protein